MMHLDRNGLLKALRKCYSTSAILDIMGIGRSTFFSWVNNPETMPKSQMNHIALILLYAGMSNLRVCHHTTFAKKPEPPGIEAIATEYAEEVKEIENAAKEEAKLKAKYLADEKRRLEKEEDERRARENRERSDRYYSNQKTVD